MGACAIARHLRSKVRDEFLGSPTPAETSERVKLMNAAAARYTNREGMVLARPASTTTGSIRTNVALPGDRIAELRERVRAQGFDQLDQLESADNGGIFW